MKIDQKTISECKKGNEKAYEKLYYDLYKPLMLVCMRYARDADEAKDIFQCGFIKVVQNIQSYKGKGSFEGWMKRIMVNEGINYYRRVNRKGNIIYMDKEANVQFHQEVKEPEVNSSLAHSELLGLVKSLSTAYRMVFTLYAIEGFSHKEIATQLNITESTSKSNLTRARVLLRKRLVERELLESKMRVKNG